MKTLWSDGLYERIERCPCSVEWLTSIDIDDEKVIDKWIHDNKGYPINCVPPHNFVWHEVPLWMKTIYRYSVALSDGQAIPPPRSAKQAIEDYQRHQQNGWI